MQVSRRGFLGGLLALAAVAAVPAVASTPNKYQEAIRLYDACLPVADNCKEVSKRYDALLSFLHTNFPTPAVNDTTVAALQKVLWEFNAADVRGIPPRVADEIYPIALTKMALTQDRMCLDPDLLTEFDKFHQRYGQLISQACDDRNRKPLKVTSH